MAADGSPPAAILVAAASDGMRTDVVRQLERRYAADYRILAVRTMDACDRLEALASAGERLALLLADDPEPGSSPVSVFAAARRLFPEGRRGRLIERGAWADPLVTRTVLSAMAEGLIEYYVLRPGPSPDESFHRSVVEFLIEWMRSVGVRQDLTLVGDDAQPRTHQLRSVVARSGVSSRYVAPDTAEGREFLAAEHLTYTGAPLVRLADGRVLVDPTNTELFAAYGLTTDLPERQPVDVAVVGAGPGGLAAAVYAASEGLSTLVLERDAVGGQAGSSSLIRNYLGFSRGVTGTELAQRAYQQAWVFGARFAHTREVTAMAVDQGFRLRIDGREELTARTVVLATGVSYRRLDVGSLAPFVGAAVFYGASAVEARSQAGRTVHVVGGGNSAGQAALHLARYARDVHIVVRGEGLAESMSRYLIDELAAAGVNILTRRKVVGGGASSRAGRLDHLVLRHRDSGEEETVHSDAVFVTIGALPHTDWLDPLVRRDKWGFVLTGAEVLEEAPESWPLERGPGVYESSVPGFFAVGDVRRGSVKRVANAVGEGSAVISAVHEALAEQATRATAP